MNIKSSFLGNKKKKKKKKKEMSSVENFIQSAKLIV